jgi:hypothetical protein
MFNLIRQKFLPKFELPKKYEMKIKKPKFLINIKDSLEDSMESLSLSSNNVDKRKIIEILFEEELIIILMEDGEIILYDIITTKTKKITKYSSLTKMAKSLYINSMRKSLLITYIKKRRDLNEGFELKLSEITINKLKERHFNKKDFSKIIKNESMVTPAFIEFDDYNKILLTMNSLGTYKIWNLKDYSKKMEITDKRIEETRLSKDTFIVIKTLSLIFRMYLQIYDIRNGKILYNFEIELIPDCSLSFIEIFGNVLFLKQIGHLPMLINLLSIDTYFLNEDLPDDTIFIYASKHKIVFGFNIKNIFFFDLKGNILKRIINNNNYLFYPKDILISKEEKFLVFCYGVNINNNLNNSDNKSYCSNSSLYTIKRDDLNNLNSENSLFSSFSKSNFDLNIPFNCQISEVKNKNNNENNINKNENTNFSNLSSIITKLEYQFKFEIFNLDDINHKNKYIYLPKGIKNSKFIFSEKYMKGFIASEDGSIFEIDF